MALQFDGDGSISIPAWVLTGTDDFSISVKVTYESGSGVILGNSTSSTSFFGTFAGGLLRFKINNVNLDITGLTVGNDLDILVERVSGTVTMTELNTGFSNFITSTAALTLDLIGTFTTDTDPTVRFTGVMSDSLILNGAAAGDRNYSFNQAPGTLTLPDSISGQDGTLNNFTTGDFIGVDFIGITTPDASSKCHQADGNGEHTFTVSGTYASATAATSIEYSFDNANWFTLDAAPTGSTYTGNVIVQGQKDIYIRISNVPSINTFITNVTAGFTIAAMFQSNELGQLQNFQTYTVTGDNPTPMMYKSGTFSEMQDPTNIGGTNKGSIWPLIAQKYSDAGIPLILANVAQGGTSISEWQKLAGTGYYPRITDFYNDVGGLNMVVGTGGEADAVAGETTAQVITWLNDFVNDINADFGCNYYQTYFPYGDGLVPPATQQQVDDIRAAYDDVITNNNFCFFGGDLSVIDIDIATYVGNDGVHIYSDAAGQEAADIRYAAISSTTLNITNTGAPDGAYDAVMWNNNRAIVYNGTVTISSGDMSVVVPAIAGSTIRGDVYDPVGLPEDGMRIQGVTV